MTTRKPELLAPAGDWECVRAAVANGADAVYFGLPRFNARLRADNFREDELPELMEYLHDRGVKGYVALNTLIFPSELPALADELSLLEQCGVDAVIVQDIGAALLSRRIAPSVALHASTQMTITSPEGAAFARDLGVSRVVVARELSLRELAKFPADAPPLEVFVHGALCVAYSGQCLTSESLGRRSANRGECAQACRLPYELVVDGAVRELGDRRYLLSPQDLAAVEEIPALIRLGVESFKIEGRLKSPEYVAAVTQVYRRAIDAALKDNFTSYPLPDEDRYKLEMTFSRGLFSGWMHGVNHQKLVPARFGKKRGPFAGFVREVGRDYARVDLEIPIRPGDGVVFDTGEDTEHEQGGRVYSCDHQGRLRFERGRIDFSRIRPGHRIWKTDDPALTRELRATWARDIPPQKNRVDFLARGRAGSPLRLICSWNGGQIEVESSSPLQPAQSSPLTPENLARQLGKLGGTQWEMGTCQAEFEGPVFLPIAELNALRRRAVEALDASSQSLTENSVPPVQKILHDALARIPRPSPSPAVPNLLVLCRTLPQVETCLKAGIRTIYADFEDIRRYRDAVQMIRDSQTGSEIFLATPRIQKAGEQGFFKLIASMNPDGILVRNLGAIDFFRREPFRRVGDFSLNVANALTAEFFINQGLERLTISYDLHAEEALNLISSAPAEWFELTIHQHMPMFHMEHCVFAAFLSKGTDHTNCGRPCEHHDVRVRDRTGREHPLRADVGCRNTLFNAIPQTGALYYKTFHAAGLRHFRVELLGEDPAATRKILSAYQALITGHEDGSSLWKHLQASSQLGVTRGTLVSTV